MSLWFEEKLEIGLGRSVKVEYTEKIVSHRSKFQQIDIYNTIPFGKMLVHDDVIMLTEADEAHYHEMIAHVALSVHPKPENVLVIGGGDGGTVREVLKHKDVKSVHLCEIDKDVVDLCKEHLPSISCGLDDPRVEEFYQDGAEFVKRRKNHYQVIIVDSSDPIGPAEVLFKEAFYHSLKESLSDDGIVITQSESFLYHKKIIGEIASFNRKIFPGYYYYYTLVPTYPSGVIGFSFCSKKYNPINDFKEERAANIEGLKYYTPEIHQAAFVLPRSFSRFLEEST